MVFEGSFKMPFLFMKTTWGNYLPQTQFLMTVIQTGL